MKKIFASIFSFVFLIVGCTFEYAIRTVNVDAIPPAITKKIPLDVAISIPDEAETISTHLQPDIVGIFPVGQLIKKASQDIFPHMFNTATLIKGRYYPPGVNGLLVTKVKEFKGKQPYCGILGCKSDLTMSINFILLDTKGIPVWETVVSSSKSKKDPNPFSKVDIHGQTAAELVNEIFQKAAEEMLMSREIYNYASAGGKSEEDVDVKVAVSPGITVNDLQKVKRIAVVIGTESHLANIMADNIALELMNLGFQVIERASLNKILSEHELGMTGLLDTVTVAKAGKILGVDAVVLGNVTTSQKTEVSSGFMEVISNATMRVVEVEQGNVLIMVTLSYKKGQKPTEAAKTMATALAEKLKNPGKKEN